MGWSCGSFSKIHRLTPIFYFWSGKWEMTLTLSLTLSQWKFNTLYILDFKPNAKKENKQKVASQLMLYAHALSVRTGVPLKQMRCAWFDGEDFFSFKPAQC